MKLIEIEMKKNSFKWYYNLILFGNYCYVYESEEELIKDLPSKISFAIHNQKINDLKERP